MNKRVDGRSLRKIPNARQFNTKITEQFYQKIYDLAQEEGVLIKEVIEKAVNFYLESKKQKKEKNTISFNNSKEKETKTTPTLIKKRVHKKKV
ncbi:MAG: hypothetical protein GBAus27B_000146 [Mycoplasmataceae bacterium]|nr:MAG: hypothetical protein GBAus27B_000146 [Mycoplasmataceae bacterium]